MARHKNQVLNFSGIAIGSQMEFLQKENTKHSNGVEKPTFTMPPDKKATVAEKRYFPNGLRTVEVLKRNTVGLIELKDKSYDELRKEWLQSVSNGLTFDEDVICTRGERDISAGGDIIKRPLPLVVEVPKVPKDKQYGRHNSRCPELRHMPCHLQITSKFDEDQDTKPMPTKQATMTLDLEESKICPKQTPKQTISTFSNKQLPVEKKSHSWDEYLITLLSKDTARLIVKQYTSGQQHSKLKKTLKARDLRLHEKEVSGLGNRSENLNSHEKSAPNSNSCGTDLQELLQSKNTKQKTAVGGRNAEENNIVKSKKQFIKLATLSKGMAYPNNDIISYKSVLQPSYPMLPTLWTGDSKKDGKKFKLKIEKMPKGNKVVKGLKKWIDYPAIEDDARSEMKILTSSPMTSKMEINLKTVKAHKENENLVKIADEWRSQWFLERKWEESSPEQILKAMHSINDHTRLAAVSACSKAILLRNRKAEMKAELLTSSHQLKVEVPDNVVQEIIKLLDDICNEVRVAAAISLFTLNRGTQKAKEILLTALNCGGPPDKWAAAQCLANSLCSDDIVLKELVHNANSTDATKSFKAAKLLAELSTRTGSIQYMLAEQLNSSSWRDRATACHLLPLLKEGISKDISSKLSHLMWHDWSKAVRVAAARALGRTGNGKLVHDRLKERLVSGNESEKVDALKKVGNLGIITVRLLPCLLNCLKDDYVSVRMEAIKTTSAVQLNDPDALEVLLKLASEDRSWKVKAFALKALGKIGVRSESVRSMLLWSLRYENQPAVRAEACHALGALKYNDEETTKILQDRVTLEECDIVKREVVRVLDLLGHEPTGNLLMQVTIQNEVKRLCNRNDVAAFILEEEDNEISLQNYQKYIAREGRIDSAPDFSDDDSYLDENVRLDYTLMDPSKAPHWFNALSNGSKPQRQNMDGLMALSAKKSLFAEIDLNESSSETGNSLLNDSSSEDDLT